jgi:geranylgeranyl diphosphate synthase type II
MYQPEELSKMVNEAIAALPYDRKPGSLYAPIQYVLSLGGKRIRPVLMLMAYNLYKEDPQQVLSQAIGLETYHNFTLLHDDLMDQADMRRGHETVHRKWNANQAILSGDTMILQAFQHVTDCPPEVLKGVMQLFIQTSLEIDEGQQYDVEFETRDDVTEDEYIEMIRLKTSVFLACALKMGGLLAGASEADQTALYNLGEKIGLAFQLQDDLLDVYGDPKVFGKNIGGDITSNKKTYMLINALNLANPIQRKSLERWIEAERFDRNEKVAAVTALYNAIGIRQLCENRINHYFEQGRQYLEQLSVADDRKVILRQYLAQMMKREW